MAMLFLQSIGPKGEELALAAGEKAGIPVGFDPEFESATFDSDGADEAELQTLIFEELEAIDPSWREHLELAE